MGKINGSAMSGPIRAQRIDSGKKVLGRQATVTVAALGAAAEEIYEIADLDAVVGDIIVVSPNVAPEAGFGIICAWVDAAGVIKVKASNFGAGNLTGGSLVLNYAIQR